MMNKAFMQQSTAQKALKLDAVLRNRTNNALESEEIRTIIRHVSPMFQYVIDVYSDPQAYCEALFPDGTQNLYGKVIFGNIILDNRRTTGYSPDSPVMDENTAAAIITKTECDGQLKNAIIIYVPEHQL